MKNLLILLLVLICAAPVFAGVGPTIWPLVLGDPCSNPSFYAWIQNQIVGGGLTGLTSGYVPAYGGSGLVDGPLASSIVTIDGSGGTTMLIPGGSPTTDANVRDLNVAGSLRSGSILYAKIAAGGNTDYFIAASDATALEKMRAIAVCTGTGDQTIINSYIGNNRKVVLSAGNFYQSGAIIVSANDVTLEGQGTSTKIHNRGDLASAYCGIYQGGPNHDITIKNLEVNEANYTGYDGGGQGKGIFINGYNIDINLCYNIVIDGVTARNTNSEGICVDYATEVQVKNCHTEATGWSGITLASCARGKVYNNDVNNSGNYNNAELSRGIAILGTPNVDVYDNHVLNGKRGGIGINSDQIYFTYGAGSRNITIRNNYVKNFTANAGGITVSASDSNAFANMVRIIDNDINTTANVPAIDLAYVNDVVVTGNMCAVLTTGNWIKTAATCNFADIRNNRYKSTNTTSLADVNTAGTIIKQVALNSVKAADVPLIMTRLCVDYNTVTITEINQIDVPRAVKIQIAKNGDASQVYTFRYVGVDQYGNDYNNTYTANTAVTTAIISPPSSKITSVALLGTSGVLANSTFSVVMNDRFAIGYVARTSGVIKAAKDANDYSFISTRVAGTYPNMYWMPNDTPVGGETFTLWVKEWQNIAMYDR
jgi:hypothetical protein